MSSDTSCQTITICGSVTKTSRHYWDKLAQELTLGGNLVFTVNVWRLRDWLHNSPDGQKYKIILDQVHKLKISKSDTVHVLMKDGYIGESTQSEIDYAKSLGKPIIYIDVDDWNNSSHTTVIQDSQQLRKDKQ